MESVSIRQYPLAWHGSWSIDFDALERALSARTRAIVVVNPNNPTGSYLKREERDRLEELARARGLALICDEVFSDYAFAGDERRAATLAGTDNAYVMSGLSKIAGLPQMKLGWIVAPDGPSYERLEWIADTYLSVATPVQHALPRLLEAGAGVREQIRARTRANLAFLQRRYRPGIALPRAARRGRLVRNGSGAAHPHRGGVGAGASGARRRARAAGLFLRLRIGGVSGAEPVDCRGGIPGRRGTAGCPD